MKTALLFLGLWLASAAASMGLAVETTSASRFEGRPSSCPARPTDHSTESP